MVGDGSPPIVQPTKREEAMKLVRVQKRNLSIMRRETEIVLCGKRQREREREKSRERERERSREREKEREEINVYSINSIMASE